MFVVECLLRLMMHLFCFARTAGETGLGEGITN